MRDSEIIQDICQQPFPEGFQENKKHKYESVIS